MGIIISNTLDKTIWREFADRNPQGNIFHTPEMFQVFSQAKGYHPQMQAAVSEDGQVKALLLPVEVSLREGLPSRLTARSIAYGSILCAEDQPEKEALSTLLRHYIRNSGKASLFTELRHLSDMSAYQSIFAQYGFQFQEHLDYFIDLNCSSEEVFNRFGKHTRKHIRHAAKGGQVIIEEVQQRDQVKHIYALLKKSYAAAHVPMADISLFEAAFDILHPHNMVKFWLARIEDTPIASSVELVYKDVIYGWYGGVDRDYSSYTPTELLTWHILKWGAENGFRTYDFGGAGTPGEEYGVRDFKSKFGGQLVCYGRNVFVPAPVLFRMSEMGYSLLRRFMAPK